MEMCKTMNLWEIKCTEVLSTKNHSQFPNLYAIWLHMLSQPQLIQLLSVGYSIVPYDWVSQGQNLTFVAGVSQGLRVPKAGEWGNGTTSTPGFCVEAESVKM